MKENYTVCNCMKVSFGDIEDALHNLNSFSDVLEAFNGVQMATKCSTGCGGCH
ncbi:MAG: (2Fe-2S)-binding protein, partial [Clostridia bacterium]|nr:(2Fe-2S)-binding protein [Clostridia bacterium]